MKKRYFITVLCIAAVIGAAFLIVRYTRVPIPDSSSGRIATYTRNKPDAELTVAVINENGTEIKAYGHDGAEIEVPKRSYEIGEITGTFTGALLAEACEKGLVSLDDPISDVIHLTKEAYSPTLFELVTQSSAYAQFFPRTSGERSDNPYGGISGNDIVSAMNTFRLTYEPPFLYSASDFGVAVLGSAIAKLYDVDFYSILTIFAQEKLGLEHTFVPLEKCMDNGWKWSTKDAYIAAKGFVSDISDMISYAKVFLNDDFPFIRTASDALYETNAEKSSGFLWNVSRKGWILSQSGETDHYSASVMIDKNNRIAVVVLSNYPNDAYGDTMGIAESLLKEQTESLIQ